MPLTAKLRAVRLALLLTLTAGVAEAQGRSAGVGILGRWQDDYGNSFHVSDSLFEQLPGARYRIVEWSLAKRYFIAQNDPANNSDGGRWTRVDWMPFDGMAPFSWGFCFTAYRAATRDEARATLPAQRDTPRTGCNGFPFSRMKPSP